jgi:hypothetical protein
VIIENSQFIQMISLQIMRKEQITGLMASINRYITYGCCVIFKEIEESEINILQSTGWLIM